MNNPLQLALNNRQTRIVAGLLTQHGGTVTGVNVVVETDDGRKVIVSPSGCMMWLKRDEVVD